MAPHAARWLLAVALAWAQAADAPPTAEQISHAVEQLSAAEFDTRETATLFLWKAGEAAEAALRQAAKSTDAEVRTRAAMVLSRIEQGIRPETPPEVVALIDQFRSAPNASQRQQTLVELKNQGQWQVILTLLRSEQNEAQRRNLARAVVADAAKLLPPLLERGELAQAEQILELTAVDDAGTAQLASFLLATDRLASRIERLRAGPEAGRREDDWRRLAYLLRARDDLPAAIDAAGKTSDLLLRANLLAEAGRWNEAAAIAADLFGKNPVQLEMAALAATLYRLAGNQTEHERLLAALLKTAKVEELLAGAEADKRAGPFGAADNVTVNNLLTAAKTLLVNERIDEALAIMRKINPPFAHRIYWRQHRHREALEFAKVSSGNTLDRAWLDELPTPPPLLLVSPDYRFTMAAQVARQLRELGRKEQVEQIWQLLQNLERPENDRGRRLLLLALLAGQLGRYDDATRCAADAVAAGQPAAAVLNSLAGREGPLALAWHERSLVADPQADQQKAIALAIAMVAPNPRRGGPPENWRQIVADATASVQSLPPSAKAARLVAFGQTCQLRGDAELARQLFAEAAQADPKTSTSLGDLAATAGDWAGAGAHYAAALKANPANALAGFLLGHSLLKSGEVEAGARQLRAANVALLVPQARLDLATTLRVPSLKDEAVRQLEVVSRTAPLASTQAMRAAQEIGNIVSTNEPRRSAECWQQVLLNVLKPGVNFNEPEAYLVLSHVVHKVLARAALTDSQGDTCAAELARCQQLLPGDLRLTVDLIPVLRRGGMGELADQVFGRAIAVHRRVLDEFPSSATYLNNLAWIYARSQRELDEALSLVEKAIELAPDQAGYYDTLAEVHFQRGHRGAAVAAANKAVELAPANKPFAARLKHFQDDELKSLDRVEAN